MVTLTNATIAERDEKMKNEKRLVYVDDVKEALLGWETDPTDEEIEYTIDHIPTIDAVEVVHGRWEEYQVPHIMCCSECDWATGVQDDFNYCPNCGAKMDGDGNA